MRSVCYNSPHKKGGEDLQLEGKVFDINIMAHNAATVYAYNYAAALTQKGETCTIDDIVQAYVSAYSDAVSFTPEYLNAVIRPLK